MNYFKWHIGDYSSATEHLSWDEDMAYTRLLRAYYRDERPIPPDLAKACRLARAQTRAQRSAVEAILHEYFVLEDDGWHNKRADQELAWDRAFIASQTTKGKAGANARWHGNGDAPAIAPAIGSAMNGASHGHDPAIAERWPPTPTPTPTPTPKHQRESSEAAAPQKPLSRGVSELKNWKPEPDVAEALRAERPDLDHPVELLKFRDHHIAKGSHKADWNAAFRLWIRNARPGRKGASKRVAKTPEQLEAEEADRNAQH